MKDEYFFKKRMKCRVSFVNCGAEIDTKKDYLEDIALLDHFQLL